MNNTVAKHSEIQELERKLLGEKDFRQRLVLLDQLIEHFVFTNVQKAQSLLAELKTALQFYPNTDVQLNYNNNKALVENQLYNYILAELNFSKVLVILDEIGNAQQQIDTFIDYAGVLINLNRKEEAHAYLEKASNMLRSFPNEQLEARMICREGFLELHSQKYTAAIALLHEAEQKINTLKIDLSLKDHYFLTLIYSGLGNIYKEIEEKEKCVDAYLRVLEICNTIGMKTRLSWHYLNVADAYMAMNDLDKAEHYLLKSIDIPDDINQSARAGAFGNLGRCCFLRGKYREALTWYNKADRLYKEKGEHNLIHLFRIESWKAQLYKARGKDNKTQKHLIKAFHIAKKMGNSKLLSVILEDIADYYKEIKEYENAYSYLELHTKYTKKYYEELNARKIWELEIHYETEKRKQQAELLELEAEKLKSKALRAQMNPHFMYNALNAIQRYIISNDAEKASQFLASFAKLMRQSLEYSEIESITLEKEIEFLEDYLVLNQKLRLDDFNFIISIDEDIEEDIMAIPTMIIQPYVENAIEHGLRIKKNALLSIHFSLIDEETILCVVEDNGIGRSGAKKIQELEKHYKNHKSRGTNITQERLKLIRNATNKDNLYIEIIDLFDSKLEEPIGTKVCIRIPILDTAIK